MLKLLGNSEKQKREENSDGKKKKLGVPDPQPYRRLLTGLQVLRPRRVHHVGNACAGTSLGVSRQPHQGPTPSDPPGHRPCSLCVLGGEKKSVGKAAANSVLATKPWPVFVD